MYESSDYDTFGGAGDLQMSLYFVMRHTYLYGTSEVELYRVPITCIPQGAC